MASCASSDCPQLFQPRKSGGYPQLYCSVQCKRREQSRKRCVEDRDSVRLANRKSYWKHHDKNLERSRGKDHRQNRYSNPRYRQLSRFTQQRYYARKRANSPRGLPRITLLEWEALKRINNFKCWYCGCIPEKLTQDHVIPVSKGGDDSFENIVPACRTCNKRKSARLDFPL